MKKVYHIIFAFILAILLVNCNKDEENGGENLEVDPEFCQQITDTTGLNLYYFPPFTEHEWKYESHAYKVQRRQLPEDVLKSLSMVQLFNQCVWLDMALDMYLFNSYQAGFRGAFFNRFNCIQELYKRKGVHLFLEEKLRTIDVKDAIGVECFLYKHILEFTYVQKECLSLYKEDEILDVLGLMYNKIERLSYLTTLESPHYKSVDLSQWMLGIGNILIMYEYKPFMDELENDLELKSFFEGRINANANVLIKVSKFGTEYYNKIKD